MFRVSKPFSDVKLTISLYSHSILCLVLSLSLSLSLSLHTDDSLTLFSPISLTEYIFDGKSSIEESLEKAVIENERREGEKQIGDMIHLTIELVLAILRNIVVGEKPIEFAAPSGLSLTIEM